MLTNPTVRTHHVATRDDLQTLAGLHDPCGHAISFYFKPGPGKLSLRDSMIVNLRARDIISSCFCPGRSNSGLLRDLDALLAIAEDSADPHAPMKAVFACHDLGIWQEFELPSSAICFVKLEVGKQFDLTPLQRLVSPEGPASLPD